VREAGFQPNQKQGAIDDSVLLDRLITLVRELRHFPVAAEIRLEHAQDPMFPNVKTFARFGLKHELIAKLRGYCESKVGYDDVVTICAGMTPSENERPLNDGKGAEPASGFVYLMKSGKHYKIGCSNSVGRREYELGILLPDPPSTVHKIKTDDPAGIEAYWHGRFAAKRKGGEWFELDAADVKAFKRRTFM
jgi:hypothetical protein